MLYLVRIAPSLRFKSEAKWKHPNAQGIGSKMDQKFVQPVSSDFLCNFEQLLIQMPLPSSSTSLFLKAGFVPVPPKLYI